MKKGIFTAMSAALLLNVICPLTSFAGEWKHNDTGWWYVRDDATIAKNGWNWIDGRCYYFTPDGYCLINTITPDGYMVDANGAWTVDGIVQIQNGPNEQAYIWGDLKLTTPEGFRLLEMSHNNYKFFSYDYKSVIALGIVEYNVSDITDEMFDSAAENGGGNYTSKSLARFGGTTWRRYYFDTPSDPNLSGMATYYRQADSAIYIVICATSDDSGPFEPDAMMERLLVK